MAIPHWQSNSLVIISCHQSFLLHFLSLTCWKLLPFLESILFFSYDFKNTEHLITLVNSNAVSREPLFLLLQWYHCQLNWRAWPWQYVKWAQSRLCTLLLQSGAASFCENYAKLYLDAKHLEKGLNGVWWDFRFAFFQKKKCPFWPILEAVQIF